MVLMEQGLGSLVQLGDGRFALGGGQQFQEIVDLGQGLVGVHQDLGDLGGEMVAQEAGDDVLLLVQQGRGLLGLPPLFDFFPEI